MFTKEKYLKQVFVVFDKTFTTTQNLNPVRETLTGGRTGIYTVVKLQPAATPLLPLEIEPQSVDVT